MYKHGIFLLKKLLYMVILKSDKRLQNYTK